VIADRGSGGVRVPHSGITSNATPSTDRAVP